MLTTLDITPAVVREAVENDCQLIVSHHPVIFHPLRTLAADDVPALLMKNGISAICMHTNLDAAPGGVNDTLCDILGIAAEGRESFAEGCGRIGTTMPTTVEALAKFWARQKGIGLVVAGHWGTEHAIADVLAVQLEKQFPALTVAHAEADVDPYSYLL